MAEAHYYYGMCLVNEGNLKDAKSSFETYPQACTDRSERRNGQEHPGDDEVTMPPRRGHPPESGSGARSPRGGRAPSGRPSEDITLIAVSKTFNAEAVRAAVEAGQRVFGENRVQEALDKMQEVAGRRLTGISSDTSSRTKRNAQWRFACLHAIDSVELMSRIDAAAAEAGRTPRVLVQVDLADEPTKYGAPVPAVRQVVAAGLACRAVRLVRTDGHPAHPDGCLKTPAPGSDGCATCATGSSETVLPSEALRELSMGMSHRLRDCNRGRGRRW